MNNLRAGKIFFKINGTQYRAKGEFTYNLGVDKKTMIPGQDGVHGYKTETVVPFIEGTITDGDDVDAKLLAQMSDETVTLELANGKVSHSAPLALRRTWTSPPEREKSRSALKA